MDASLRPAPIGHAFAQLREIRRAPGLDGCAESALSPPPHCQRQIGKRRNRMSAPASSQLETIETQPPSARVAIWRFAERSAPPTSFNLWPMTTSEQGAQSRTAPSASQSQRASTKWSRIVLSAVSRIDRETSACATMSRSKGSRVQPSSRARAPISRRSPVASATP